MRHDHVYGKVAGVVAIVACSCGRRMRRVHPDDRDREFTYHVMASDPDVEAFVALAR